MKTISGVWGHHIKAKIPAVFTLSRDGYSVALLLHGGPACASFVPVIIVVLYVKGVFGAEFQNYLRLVGLNQSMQTHVVTLPLGGLWREGAATGVFNREKNLEEE